MREQITKILDIAEKTYYNWKNQKRPIIILLEKYFSDDELDEFLKSGKIERLETIKDISTDDLKKQLSIQTTDGFNNAMEDYIVINLKRFHKMDRNKLFNLFFPSSEFITRHLKQIESLTNLHDLTIENAREKFKEFLTKIPINKFLDSEQKRQKILEAVDIEYADIELYVILKHRRKFI